MRDIVRVGLGVAAVVLGSTTVFAQEDLEHGKTGAQLYASDCGSCHKSAQALIKEGYPTEGFLRVHYTSSREAAAVIFTYLRGVAKADAAESRATHSKPGAKKDEPRKKGNKHEGKNG